jgi:UDP-glucose 4-epimerase
MPETIAVLGAGGFIGRATRAVLERGGWAAPGFDVAPAPDLTGRVDVTDLQSVLSVLAEARPRAVVNLAYILGRDIEADPYRATRVNVLGMQHVFEACRLLGIERCVYASSIAVYGDQGPFGDRAVREEDHGHPTNLYGWQKQMNEAVAGVYRDRYGLDAIGLRISTVYGGDRRTGLSAPINELVLAAASGSAVHCPFRADCDSDLVHVEDVAETLAAVATAPRLAHPVYNTGGEFATIGDLVELARELHPDVRVTLGDDRMVHVSRVDWSRLRAELPLERPSLRDRVRAAFEGAAAPR